MTFGQPIWFWAFALFPALIVLVFSNESRRAKLLRLLVAARLQDRLAGSVSVAKRRFRFLLILLGLAGVIGALVQPRLGYTWETSQRKGRDVLLAIDCSKSMLATDLAPSRLGRAKLAAQDLIGQLQGDRAGLIAFAGSAFLQAPMTVDYSAVLASLGELDTDIIPRGGSNIAAAIKTAVEAFGKGESDNRALILFTDGEELDDDAVKAAEALNGTVRIYAVGIGSTDGSLIPVPGANGGTEFVKDENGQNVKSRLDEDRLRKIAESTGGFYVHLESGPAETLQIVREGLAQMKEQDIDAKVSRRPIERYQWPLAAGLVLLASSMLVGERRRTTRRAVPSGKVAALLAAGLFATSAGWAKNAGVEAYEREDYKGAADLFTKQLERMPESEALHFNHGAAAYKQRDYAKALDAFSKAVTSPDPQLRAAAEYNLGNTLYQRGAAQKEKPPKVKEWKNALQHYDQALNVQPGNKEAKYNRDLVQRLIDELEKEPPKSDDQKPDQKKDENKKNEDTKQPKDGDKKNDQKQNPQDQQKQDQKSQGDQPQQDKQDQSGKEKSEEKGQDDKGKQQDGKQGDEPEKKGEQGKEKDNNRDGTNEPKEQGEPQNGEQAKDGKKAEQPKPDPNQPERKLAGDIKPKNDQPAQPTPQEQEAADAQAAEEGKMTEAQAKGLLDSLKGEDSRVQLLKPGERRAGGRVLRDW
ncbi:MAG: VWA domain-containing protein [Chthoniobacter sp.]|nr:VWA domain-containing protein [Chthoniobacter sp.]